MADVGSGTTIGFDPGGDLATVDTAIADIAGGRPVIVVGCEAGDGGVVFAASRASTALMAFVVRHTSGFVCVALPGERCDELELPPMHRSHAGREAAFCVTVDASSGVGTGISAADRTRTVRLLADEDTRRSDFTRPGHVVPLATGAAGVLGWAGLAEAASDLALLAGEPPVAAFGHLVSTTNPTYMATEEELRQFGVRHDIAVLELAELMTLRRNLREPVPSS